VAVQPAVDLEEDHLEAALAVEARRAGVAPEVVEVDHTVLEADHTAPEVAIVAEHMVTAALGMGSEQHSSGLALNQPTASAANRVPVHTY
jgi:hypothetical protein